MIPLSPRPLVVMLHGAGSNGPAAAFETGWCEKADEQCFIVACPNALAVDPAQPAHFRSNQQVWSDLSGRFRGQEVDDCAYLASVIDDVMIRGGVDPLRIYLTGFSNGASIAFLAAAKLSGRFAAVAPVAGACWFQTGAGAALCDADAIGPWGPPAPLGASCSQGVPTLYITGDSDTLNPIDGGVLQFADGSHVGFGGRAKPPVALSLQRWAAVIGLQSASIPVALTSTRHDGTDGAHPESLAPPLPAWLSPFVASAPRAALRVHEWRATASPTSTTPSDAVSGSRRPASPAACLFAITIVGHGHSWPGGRTPHPASTVGASSAVLRATDVIWEFFQQCTTSMGYREEPLAISMQQHCSSIQPPNLARVSCVSLDPAVGVTSVTVDVFSPQDGSVSTAVPVSCPPPAQEITLTALATQSHPKAAVRSYYSAQAETVAAYDAARVLLEQRGMGGAFHVTADDDAAQRYIQRVIRITFYANVLLFIFKIAAAVYSRSLAVIGSAIDSSMDVFSGSILFIAAWMASKRDPTRFPIGKARMEPLAIVVFASVMSMAALQLLVEGVRTILEGATNGPGEIFIDAFPLAALVAAIVFKGVVFIVAHKHRHASASIAALQQDARNDIVTNVAAVIAVLVASRVPSVWWLDPAFAMGLACMIVITWSVTIKSFVYALSGETADSKTISQLIFIAANHDARVTHVESLVAYHVGTNVIVEADLVLPATFTLAEAHDIGESLQHTYEKMPFVERAFVHVDFDKSHSKPEHSGSIAVR